MKIQKENTQGSNFGKIKKGECFGFSGNVYIKLDINSTAFNATRLNDGYLGKFEEHTSVTDYPNAVLYVGKTLPVADDM